MKRSRVSFKTVGCRLNQAETAAIRASFRAAGFVPVPFGDECEVCVVHGCAVTSQAERDSLRLARRARRLNQHAFIVLAGCIAEKGGEEALARCGADLAAGQNKKFELPAILKKLGSALSSDSGRLLPEFETTRAIVKIQDGCDFFCSYCIVPLLRGGNRSRPSEEVLTEMAGLAGAGFKEITLTGANIGCYNDRGKGLIALLEQAEDISGLKRIRISSIEVSTIERRVIDFMSGSRKLCPHLHLPLQSGDDTVLRAMGRRYSSKEYRAIAEYAAEKLGQFGFGTDVLVGFPGESEIAFSATESLVSQLPFSRLHVFSFSERPGTRASERNDHVPASVKKRRAARLTMLGEKKQNEFAKSCVGRKTSVLIEKLDEVGRGMGWTAEYSQAIVTGADMKINQLVCIIPHKAEGGVVFGKAIC